MRYVTIESRDFSTSVEDILIKYFNSSNNNRSKESINDYYISFTSETKVGVYPYSCNETPNGVYAWPISYIIGYWNADGFPFVNRPYMQVLKLNTDKILSNWTKSGYEKAKEKIKILFEKHKYEIIKTTSKKNMFSRYGNYIENIVSWEDFISKVETFFNKMSVYKTRNCEEFFKIFAITGIFSNAYKGEVNKSTNYWNWLLRHLGYDAVLDMGKDVIYPGEPYQIVFLTPKAYKHIETIDKKNMTKPIDWKSIPDEHLIPKNLIVKHTLSLEESKLTNLPRGLTVHGDLILNDLISELPENLTVDGNLYLNKLITKLPKNLTVMGKLFQYSKIEKLSENTTTGSLNFSYNKKLKSLPKKLVVKGLLFLDDSGIESLPPDLQVNGDLYIRGVTKLTEIPLTMKIEGKIFISTNMNITNLEKAKKKYKIEY